MKVSYVWLQSYFDTELPHPDELAEMLTFHSFEIESVEKVESDMVIDIDVLPNRSSDCLSHRGIARELATLLNLKLKDDPLKKQVTSTPDSNVLEVNVESPELVNRFSAAVINNVAVGESPEWIQKRLRAIGQKSINSIVDATNYVMFDVGQPLHAFDLDKLKEGNGGRAILVRTGKGGEKITTLTKDTYDISEKNLLIVDGNADLPIGIAGVKGGAHAEIDDRTKNIVIEAANFNYVSVRKTAQELKLGTDASMRFQNQPSPELTLHALREVILLIGGELEGFVDYYPNTTTQGAVSVTVSEINELLGTSIKADGVENILKQFAFDYTRKDEKFTVLPPFERTDLTIKEDLIEEVGRVYGYEHVEAEPLPEPQEASATSKQFYYAEKIREILIESGFSEVYTYALRPKGEVELANALAKDKPFLRANLSDGLRESLGLNVYNAELLGLEQVCLFEVGTVFSKSGEHVSFAFGVRDVGKKTKQSVDETMSKTILTLSKELAVEFPSTSGEVWETNLTELLKKFPDPESYELSHDFEKTKTKKFKPISPYPFVLRDIAVWIPRGTADDAVMSVVHGQAGELLANHRLFDVYEKDERVSYAFRLVFQSHEKTLSDEEVNKVMEKVTTALCERDGWEVR